MLSRLRQRGISRITQSASVPIFGVPLLHEQIHRTTTDASTVDDRNVDDRPIYEKPMKKPIITGRNSSTQEPHELPEPFTNPFIGKDLPYGRKIIYDNLLEEDLANGHHWHVYNDRFMQWLDMDFVERGWGNVDLYKSPIGKRGCDDITMSHDIDYHYKLHNIGMHLEMMQYIPHLKPLYPELKADFEAVTAKWQDVVEDILGEDEVEEEEVEEVETRKTEEIESVTEYETKTTTIETKKTKTKLKKKKKKGFDSLRSYKLSTTINSERPLCGEDLIAARKEKIRKEQNYDPTTEVSRKEIVKREIELNTMKKFVDDKVEEKDFVRLIFVDAMGTKYYVYGVVGETLLQCCRRYLIPIDGYCNGFDRGIVRIYGKGPWCHLCQMDISPKFFHLIPPFDWRERLAFINFRHLTPTSRLGCCVWIRPEFDGMLINIPVSIPNPYGRFQD